LPGYTRKDYCLQGCNAVYVTM